MLIKPTLCKILQTVLPFTMDHYKTGNMKLDIAKRKAFENCDGLICEQTCFRLCSQNDLFLCLFNVESFSFIHYDL